MTNGNGRPDTAGKGYSRRFPVQVATWIATNPELISILLILRGLGDEGAAAVDAVRNIRRVAKLRLSLELWQALCEEEGDDAEAILLEQLPLPVLKRLRQALWGSPWDDTAGSPQLRIVAG